MNITQELITNAFTIGHATRTIKALRDNAKDEIHKFTETQVKEQLLNEGSQLEKLRTVFFNLDDLFKECSRVEALINSIDDEKPPKKQ